MVFTISKDEKKILIILGILFLLVILITIYNSGLIILWPYLYTLCEKLNYTQNKKFINDELQNRAVILSQYLVTGSTTILIFDLNPARASRQSSMFSSFMLVL